jgi:hypothetical protein
MKYDAWLPSWVAGARRCADSFGGRPGSAVPAFPGSLQNQPVILLAIHATMLILQ